MQNAGRSPFVLSDDTLKSQRRRVFSIEVGGDLFFVKTDKVRKYHLGHRAQSLLYRASRNPMLNPFGMKDLRAFARVLTKLAALEEA